MIPEPLYKTLSASHRTFITLLVMSATLMQVIDTTIVNVALPHMQGSLAATSDSITWTMTSYLVASAILTPFTGYFADQFGRRQLLFISILGFTITSILCGASATLSQLIIFRSLQGLFGASLVPLSQAILTDIYPPEERGKAMAIWGIGVMVGPVIGPALGGYLTEIASWRWTFYVNAPVGLITLSLLHLIPSSPIQKRTLDWIGFILITFSIGGLQFVLDRGNQEDWFHSSLITQMSYLTITSFLLFLIRQWNHSVTPLFDLSIFKDRNFSLACFLIAALGVGLYGTMVLQPMMLEDLMHYPVLTTGLLMAPRGISGMVSMFIVSRIIQYYNPKILIIFGILTNAFGLWLSQFYSTEHINTFWIVMPLIVQGFGLGMVFVPLGTIAFATLPNTKRTEAAGLYNLLRTLGSSIGISIAITFFTRKTNFFWNQLIGWINPYGTNFQLAYSSASHQLTDPAALQLTAQTIASQSKMLAFINVYAFIMWSLIIMIPFVLLLKQSKQLAE